jgi:acyl-CoA synthetase (AMP-forming)/AMP-acid ligase II
VQAGNSGAARQRSGVPIWSQAAERFPPADRILSTILTRQAARYRDRTLFVFGETRWSYTETAAIAAASAARLMRAGVQAGDRVALMCSNRPEFLEIYLGCAWMGAVTVPINTALRGIQLSHILRNAAPKLLVIESGFMPAIETLESDVAPPDIVWMIGEGAGPPTISGSVSPLPALGEGAPPAPAASWKGCCKPAARTDCPIRPRRGARRERRCGASWAGAWRRAALTARSRARASRDAGRARRRSDTERSPVIRPPIPIRSVRFVIIVIPSLASGESNPNATVDPTAT